jgi:hypothetical protein
VELDETARLAFAAGGGRCDYESPRLKRRTDAWVKAHPKEFGSIQ